VSSQSGHVVVIGDAMVDQYLWGSADRMSPEAPVPVVRVHRRSYHAGGAANVAVNVVSLGGTAELLGVTGDDDAGERLRELLHVAGVGIEGLVRAARPTTLKTRIVAGTQHVCRVDEERADPVGHPHATTLTIMALQSLFTADAVVISDYAKGVITPDLLGPLLRIAREYGIPVLVDPKDPDFSRYDGADILAPNVAEASRFVRMDPSTPPTDVARRLLEACAVESVVVTCGPAGMVICERGAEPTHLPATARAVFDVTGAGDTVVATLALYLARGADIQSASCAANEAAGIVVEKAGTASVTASELTAALARLRANHAGG
jgi:D-beta-D-heptose 7-phosphate kinase/D-beta-D-heptose 1-phosphate adenosyltransferase